MPLVPPCNNQFTQRVPRIRIFLYFGDHKDIFFPKENDNELKLTHFPDIVRAYLASMGYEALEVDSEDEARTCVTELSAKKKWPCYFFKSDPSEEKPFEEFFC